MDREGAVESDGVRISHGGWDRCGRRGDTDIVAAAGHGRPVARRAEVAVDPGPSMWCCRSPLRALPSASERARTASSAWNLRLLAKCISTSFPSTSKRAIPRALDGLRLRIWSLFRISSFGSRISRGEAPRRVSMVAPAWRTAPRAVAKRAGSPDSGRTV
jgi:hypothetical protein